MDKRGWNVVEIGIMRDKVKSPLMINQFYEKSLRGFYVIKYRLLRWNL